MWIVRLAVIIGGFWSDEWRICGLNDVDLMMIRSLLSENS